MYATQHAEKQEQSEAQNSAPSTGEEVQPRGNAAANQDYFGSILDGADGGACEETPFCNQRDNETIAGAEGKVQCSPTSTTMVILAELGDTFYDVACVLMGEVGLPCRRAVLKRKQPEELVLQWMHARDWSSEFGRSIPNPIHQNNLAMAVTIDEWTGRDMVPGGGGDLRESLETIEVFPTVVGTWLTSGGHTCTLLEVRGDGVLVHDPNGARLTVGYLYNGEPPSSEAPPAQRWQDNPALAEAFAAGDVRDDWGARNFFTWAEVEDYGIGKWVLSDRES